jgi:hypothetical protein
MSEQDDELELQALQRELDDAFETTRPRRGFEDELWLRMQARRPLWTRVRDSFGALVQGVREVPAVPVASVAVALVVVIGIGIFAFSGLGRGGSSSSTGLGLSEQAGVSVPGPAGSFGRVPSPVLNSDTGGKAAQPNQPNAAAPAANSYAGPVTLTWTGQLNLTIGAAPVFRYHEPSTNTADQFASSLGAALDHRPAGYLGLYEATDYTLTVRGTVQSPPQEPAYFILSAPSMPEIAAAGAAPADIAELFLAEHSLTPQWPFTTATKAGPETTKVQLQRQFDVPGYGLASLVDAGGSPYGLEVDLNGARPVLASGPLPVSVESAPYTLISSDQAIRAALARSAPSAAANPVAPVAVQLTTANLVYTLVAAGDHSFYEPEFLFSGAFQVNGVSYVKHILVPALTPSQRS